MVGAGISGLTCAYALKKRGVDVLVLEATPHPGGVIRSLSENGFLFELGPQSFMGTDSIFALCDELGIFSKLIEVPHSAPRYILVDGKLVSVPLSPIAFLFSSLLGWQTKLSMVADLFRNSSPPEADESVAAFVRAKFTAELLDRLVGPFVSGIYAGDAEELSLRSAFPNIYEAEKISGSVIRGSFRLAKRNRGTRSGRRNGLCSFQKGNATLIEALAASLGDSLRFESDVISEIERDENHFRLKLKEKGHIEEFRAEKLVLATPAGVNSELLRKLAPYATWPLSDIEYAPVIVVSHGYRSEQIGVDLHGFGFLIPRSSRLNTLGTVWNSSLFPGRAPVGHVLLTSFIGGIRKPKIHRFSEAEGAEFVRREVADILKITGNPVVERITEYSRAIPQYNVGHSKGLDTIRQAVAQVPGLWLTGNYLRGPSIGTCIEHALSVAESIPIS